MRMPAGGIVNSDIEVRRVLIGSKNEHERGSSVVSERGRRASLVERRDERAMCRTKRVRNLHTRRTGC